MHLYGDQYSLNVGIRWVITGATYIFFFLICLMLHKRFRRMAADNREAVKALYSQDQARYLIDYERRFYMSYGLPGDFDERLEWLKKSIANTPYQGPMKGRSSVDVFERASKMENGERGLKISWPIGRPSKRVKVVKHKRSLAQDFGSWRKEREQYDEEQRTLPLPPRLARANESRKPPSRDRASRRSAAFKTSARLRIVQEEDEQPSNPSQPSQPAQPDGLETTPPRDDTDSAQPFLPELIDLPTVYHSLEAKKRRRYARVAPPSPESLIEVTPRMPTRTPTMIDSYPAPVPLTRRARTTRTSRTSSNRPSIPSPPLSSPLIDVDIPPLVPPKDPAGDSIEVPNRSTSLKTIVAGEDAFCKHPRGTLLPPPPVAYAPNGLRAKMKEDAAEWQRSGR